MNNRMVAMVVVAVVVAIAAVLFLVPSQETVVPAPPSVQGTASVQSRETPDFGLAEPVAAGSGSGVVDGSARPTAELDAPILTDKYGLDPGPGKPLTRHNTSDGANWQGLYRILRREHGETDLVARIQIMADKVKAVSADNSVASYAGLFAEERALITEVRAATSDDQAIANCDTILANIAAIEAGKLHPIDAKFEAK